MYHIMYRMGDNDGVAGRCLRSPPAGSTKPASRNGYGATRIGSNHSGRADFRDRIVHHLLVAHLERVFEPMFIHDSYACREGKAVNGKEIQPQLAPLRRPIAGGRDRDDRAVGLAK